MNKEARPANCPLYSDKTHSTYTVEEKNYEVLVVGSTGSNNKNASCMALAVPKMLPHQSSKGDCKRCATSLQIEAEDSNWRTLEQ